MATFEVTLFPSSPSMSSDVGDVGVHAEVRRHECAGDRRLRRLRSEARLRLRLVRDTVLLCLHRGGPCLRAEHSELAKKLEGEFGTFEVEVTNKFNDMQDALTASGARLELLVAGAEKSGSCLVSSLANWRRKSMLVSLLRAMSSLLFVALSACWRRTSRLDALPKVMLFRSIVAPSALVLTFSARIPTTSQVVLTRRSAPLTTSNSRFALLKRTPPPTCPRETSGSSSTTLPNVSRPWTRGCCLSSLCWSAVSSGDGCGRCTRWETAAGPGQYTDTGHGTWGVASAGPPGVREGSGCLAIALTWPLPGVGRAHGLCCWHLRVL